jgi:hypothetical protein
MLRSPLSSQSQGNQKFPRRARWVTVITSLVLAIPAISILAETSASATITASARTASVGPDTLASGVIVGANGQPMSGATVFAMAVPVGPSGVSLQITGVAQATTDNAGSFALNVDPADATMVADAVGSAGGWVHIMLGAINPDGTTQFLTNFSVSSSSTSEATASMLEHEKTHARVVSSSVYVEPNGFITPLQINLTEGQPDVMPVSASVRAQYEAIRQHSDSSVNVPWGCDANPYPGSGLDQSTINPWIIIGELHSGNLWEKNSGITSSLEYGHSGSSQTTEAVGLSASVGGDLGGVSFGTDGSIMAGYGNDKGQGAGVGASTPYGVHRQYTSQFIYGEYQLTGPIGKGGETCPEYHQLMTWSVAWLTGLHQGLYTVGGDGACYISRWGTTFLPGETVNTYAYAGVTYNKGVSFPGFSSTSETNYGIYMAEKWQVALNTPNGMNVYWFCGWQGPIGGGSGEPSPQTVYQGPDYYSSSGATSGVVPAAVKAMSEHYRKLALAKEKAAQAA